MTFDHCAIETAVVVLVKTFKIVQMVLRNFHNQQHHHQFMMPTIWWCVVQMNNLRSPFF